MRAISTLLFLLLCTASLWAQPNNDDCGDADELTLSVAPACPSTTPVVDNFSGTNIDATAISPYPTFDVCPSGSTTGPAAEVWFTFVATANQTEVEVDGLNQPNIVFYQGQDCISLIALDCTSGNGNANLTVNTLIGNTYFILVSGEDVADQGNFDLTITSNNLCSSCAPPGAIEIVPNPPPINGTYSSGQTVQFCAVVNIWEGNAAGTIEWIHAVTFEFGDGWNEGTINTNPPASCSGDGTWDWYDSWTSCNTGDSFGPGFAYDSSSGVGCGGGPNDGDPGNNWGDGQGGCSDVPNGDPGPFEFCLTIDVDECPPADTGEDLGVSVDVWSDGDSGSWTQTGCNSGQELDIISSVICCNDDDPIATPIDASCAGIADGSIEMEGNGGADPDEVFNFFVFDENNNLVFECLSCSGLIVTDSDLPAGFYSVSAVNVANDCPRSFGPFELMEPDEPQAIADVLNMPCPGGLATLEGSVDLGGGTEVYTWTGPDNTVYNGDVVDVPDAGTYTLNVTVDGCPAASTTVDVDFVDFEVDIDGPDEICFEVEFDLEADNGESWEWVNLTTGENIGDDQVITVVLEEDAIIEVTAIDENGCIATDQFEVTVFELPEISITREGLDCSNTETILTAEGAGPGGTYEWLDNGSQENPRFLNNISPGFFDFEVMATDANGCIGFATIEVIINPPPEVTLEVSDDAVCVGDMVTVTAVTTDDISAIDWNGAGPNNQNPIMVQIDDLTEIVADVTNSDGCTTSGVTTTITIQQAPTPPIISCGQNSSTSVEFLWTDVAGADEYIVTVEGEDPVTVFAPFYDVSGLGPNETINITVLAVGADICPVELALGSCDTESCPLIDLDIDDVAPICFVSGMASFDLSFTTSSAGGSAAWSGLGVNSTGTFNPNIAGVGSHDITLSYMLGTCIYTDMQTIVINATPTSNFTVSNTGPICTNTDVTISYMGNATAGATYTWDFAGGTAVSGTGQGPHTVSWPTAGTKTISLTVTENGCTSTLSSQSVSVVAPMATPVVTCGTFSTSSTSFTWPAVAGATSYTVNTISGSTMGTLMGTTYTVNNLMPGESVTITVTANTNNVCGPTTSTQTTCSAANCPNFNINITAVADICLTGSNPAITLQATATGGAGGGDFTWSGPGVTGDQFSPTAAGAGNHTIMVDYAESNCNASQMITVNVFDTPTADFTLAPATVCTNGDATVTYTGTASAGATYTWNFNGGLAVPGTGQGPHTVSWTTGGPKTVSLSVSENGCNSAAVTQNITVDEPLAAPTINCTPNTTSIVFTWDDIVGAIGYQVNVISAPAGAMTMLDEAARSFTVTSLMALDIVEIQVIALGNGPCGNSSNTFMCQAQNCPDVSLNIIDVAPICLTATALDFTLVATASGGVGAGTFTWSGDGIINAALGTFSPTLAGVGPAAVSVTYLEDGCSFVANTTIQINAVPTADFTLSSPICLTEEAMTIYTGSASTGATYSWDFGGGMGTPGTGQGPQAISWTTPGIKTVTLTVTENNCISDLFTQMTTVDAELVATPILCDVSNDSITFSWAEVIGSSGYTVTIIDAPANAMATGGDPDRTFTMSGFTPGQTATIEVQAISGTACPSITFQGTCALEDCPDVTVAIDAVQPICLDATAAAFNLSAVLTGDTGGILSWSGTGITDTAAATFDPTVSGAGSFVVTALYTETTCTYSDDITIVVNAQPNAAFMASGPICRNDVSTVTYTGGADPGADYAWDFAGATLLSGSGAGPYEVSWPDAGSPTVSLTVTENNCPSDLFSVSVSVIDSLTPPVIDCDSDNTSLTFSWNAVVGATGYTVTVISAPAGAVEMPDVDNRSFTFSNLTPSDEITIRVDVLTDNICGGVSSEQTCSAQSCEDRFFGPDGYGPFCADAGMQTLMPVISGSNVIGTITWSGTGINDPMAGTFDPATAMIGDNPILLSYEQEGCLYDTTYTIVVNAIPVPTFTVESPICIDATSTVTFTGTAGPTASYDWNFGDGMIQSGSGEGPYEIQWTSAGEQSISLMITENNCSSEMMTETVTVENTLVPPMIDCDVSNTSITFSWNDVVDATGYTVTVISAPAGAAEMADIDNRTYTFTNLTPEDEVMIQVDVLTDNVCGSVSATQTCTAQSCDTRAFGTEGYGPFCTDADVQTFAAVLSGGGLTGTFTWGGDGITDVTAGTFDLASALVGENMVTLNYEEDGCFYDTTYIVVVNPVPTSDFTVESPICLTDASTITFTGMAGPMAEYDWSFDDGNILTGSGAGPYDIQWETPGDKNISLTVTENGCVSILSSELVEVQDTIAPVVINCLQGTTSSVNFGWDPVDGADTYTVVVIDGPTGIQTGNTYAITGLSSGQLVTIEVTASGPSICGSSVATATCEAVECQGLTASLAGPDLICSGESASVTLDFMGGQGNPYTVDYTVNGTPFQLAGVDGPTDIMLDELTETTTIIITQMVDDVNPNCIYMPMAEWVIMVGEPVTAGDNAVLDAVCADDATLIDLAASLPDADAGGTWTETSTMSSTGGAFQAAAANFNGAGQAAGTYEFTYTLAGGACPDASATVSITILPEPVAAAGDDQTLTCNMGMVVIGGNADPNLTYNWTSSNPDAMIMDPTAPIIDVSAAGVYTLTVTNAGGCSDTDEVIVDTELDVPVADVSISEVSCFQSNDGAILINEVSGGVPPYTFSLNGGPATNNPFFGQLSGAEYSLVITDDNGCFSELGIMLLEPSEVAVALTTSLENNGTIIDLGESITLTAQYDPSIMVDTIIWTPDSIAIGNQQAIEVSPTETTTYTVTVTDINGCSDSDVITVMVRKERPVFVPTAFAPTGSGENQILYPFGGNDIQEIKSFMIFNRWGESVFENFEFQPNDPSQGWDGRHRGQMLNAAIFVYFMEVEYVDGEVILFKGDVMLMR